MHVGRHCVGNGWRRVEEWRTCVLFTAWSEDCIQHSVKSCTVPGGMNITALAATTTRTVRYSITRTIGTACVINTMYSDSKFEAILTILNQWLKGWIRESKDAQNDHIYGKSFGVCIDIYMYIFSSKQNWVTTLLNLYMHQIILGLGWWMWC